MATLPPLTQEDLIKLQKKRKPAEKLIDAIEKILQICSMFVRTPDMQTTDLRRLVDDHVVIVRDTISPDSPFMKVIQTYLVNGEATLDEEMLVGLKELYRKAIIRRNEVDSYLQFYDDFVLFLDHEIPSDLIRVKELRRILELT